MQNRLGNLEQGGESWRSGLKQPSRVALTSSSSTAIVHHSRPVFLVRMGVICDKWNAYMELLAQDMIEGDAQDELQLKRYCCPRMVLTHVDLIERLLHYNQGQEKYHWLDFFDLDALMAMAGSTRRRGVGASVALHLRVDPFNTKIIEAGLYNTWIPELCLI
ncbi:hypothetical protein OF83DRAFT_1173532 [Amylostereum chailletii]|nr:hypothetical protein OF83DRAFT_1173532 [Amylostereum chailletii]